MINDDDDLNFFTTKELPTLLSGLAIACLGVIIMLLAMIGAVQLLYGAACS